MKTLLLLVAAVSTATAGKDLLRINYGVALVHEDSCYLSTNSWKIAFSVQLITSRNLEPVTDFSCLSEKWKRVDRDICEFMKDLILGSQRELREMREQVHQIMIELNEIFVDAIALMISRKRSLLDAGGKLLRWTFGSLDLDGLHTIDALIKRQSQRITSAEIGIEHEVHNLRSFAKIVNDRVNHFAAFVVETNVRLENVVIRETRTIEEVTHLKNFLANETTRHNAIRILHTHLLEFKRGVEALHALRLTRAVIGVKTLQDALDNVQRQLTVNQSHLQLVHPNAEYFYRSKRFNAMRLDDHIHIIVDVPLRHEDFDKPYEFYKLQRIATPIGNMEHVSMLAHKNVNFVSFARTNQDSYYLEFEQAPKCEGVDIFKFKTLENH